jgi:hypothetical protein
METLFVCIAIFAGILAIPVVLALGLVLLLISLKVLAIVMVCVFIYSAAFPLTEAEKNVAPDPDRILILRAVDVMRGKRVILDHNEVNYKGSEAEAAALQKKLLEAKRKASINVPREFNGE